MKLLTKVEYEGMNPVTAIELGDGSVAIMDVGLDSLGRASVAFKKQLPNDVGLDSGDGGKMLDEVNPDFIITTSNVASLKVLLDKVQRAIDHLTNNKE
jgi:hypothetical protein